MTSFETPIFFLQRNFILLFQLFFCMQCNGTLPLVSCSWMQWNVNQQTSYMDTLPRNFVEHENNEICFLIFKILFLCFYVFILHLCIVACVLKVKKLVWHNFKIFCVSMLKWCTPKFLGRLNYESKCENNGRIKS